MSGTYLFCCYVKYLGKIIIPGITSLLLISSYTIDHSQSATVRMPQYESYIVKNDVWISICCSCGCTRTFVAVEKNLYLSAKCNGHNKTNTPSVVSRRWPTYSQVQCRTSKEYHPYQPTSALCLGQLCRSFEWDHSLTLDIPVLILLKQEITELRVI